MKLHRRFPATILALLSMLAPLAGCDGAEGDDEAADTGDADTETETGGALSHAADIQPIWDANCVTGCHMPGGTAASVLDLSGDAHPRIVDVDSGQAALLKLVASGNSMDSYLIAKLEGNQAAAGGTGLQMPSGGPALDAATIQTIKDWVDAGAAP
jgi:hypothetical protein